MAIGIYDAQEKVYNRSNDYQYTKTYAMMKKIRKILWQTKKVLIQVKNGGIPLKKAAHVMLIVLCLLLAMVQTGFAREDNEVDSSWVTFLEEEKVSLNKSWTVEFNKAFSASEIDEIAVEVNGNPFPVKVELQGNEKKATIKPEFNYQPDTEYIIKVLLANGNKYRKYFRTLSKGDDVSSSDIIKGGITSGKQVDEYQYTARVAGRHRFDFGTDDVNSSYLFYLYAPDNKALADGVSSSYNSGKTVDLESGKTYRLKIVQRTGKCNYTITIGVPNKLAVISGNSFDGVMRYTDQEDIYTYTAPRTGRYRFDFGTDDVNSSYLFYLYAPDNKALADGVSSSYNSGKTVDLESGKTYRLKIVQRTGKCNYTITIGVPNKLAVISGNSFDGVMRYTDQEDIYTYTVPRTGRYRFDFSTDNVNSSYLFYLYAPDNKALADGVSSSYNSGKTVDLEAGKTYRLKIVQRTGKCNYTISIQNPSS